MERWEMSSKSRTPATGQGEWPLSGATSKAWLCLLPVASMDPALGFHQLIWKQGGKEAHSLLVLSGNCQKEG